MAAPWSPMSESSRLHVLQGVEVSLSRAAIGYNCPDGHYSVLQMHYQLCSAAQSGLPASRLGACVPW